MEREKKNSYLTDISHNISLELAGYSYTLTNCLSKTRVGIEAA